MDVVGAIAGLFGPVTAVALIVVLIVREFAANPAERRPRVRRWVRALNFAIAPLLIVFAVTVAARLFFPPAPTAAPPPGTAPVGPQTPIVRSAATPPAKQPATPSPTAAPTAPSTAPADLRR